MTIQKIALLVSICLSAGIVIGSHSMHPIVPPLMLLALAIVGLLVLLVWLVHRASAAMLGITGLLTLYIGIAIGATSMGHALSKRPTHSTTTHATLMVMGLGSQTGYSHAYIQPSNRQLTAHKTSIAFASQAMPGQCYQGIVRISPYHSLASPFAFDASAWELSEGVVSSTKGQTLHTTTQCPKASGFTSKMWLSIYQHLVVPIDQTRLQLRQHFMTLQQQQPPALAQGYAVSLGLLTGDDALITPTSKNLYQQLGISHLLVISGPHVLLAALLFSYGLLWLLSHVPQVYLVVPKQHLQRGLLIAGTWAYALFAGFDPPAIRTAVMATLAIVSFRPITAVCTAACLMLLSNPLLALSVSFYLSFVSVLILVVFIQHISQVKHWPALIWAYIHTQWLTFIALTPIILYVFHTIPLFAPIANIVISPVISFIVLPLNLIAAGLYPILPVAADTLWLSLATAITAFNQAMATLGLHNTTIVVLASSAIILALGATIVQLRTHLSMRLRLVLLLSLLLCTIVWQLPAQRAPLAITQLDVGQGLSVLIQTPEHNLLYDTGGAKIDYATGTIKHTMGERIIVPYLRGKQIRKLDAIIISHSDLDHTGGLKAVIEAYPDTPVYSSQLLQQQATLPCHAPMAWQLGAVRIEVLAPATSHGLGNDNDHTCVVKISYIDPHNKPYTALIMGDAEYNSEQQLVHANPAALNADLLFVGHHGSKTSSAANFVQAVSPQYAILSYGNNNTYGHPHASVLATLRRNSQHVHSNQQLGTTTYSVNLHTGKWQYQAHRNRKPWLLASNP